MKILVLSLLRLGDILMHREIARALKIRFPQAEIHFLINSQFSSVQNLLPEVDQWKLLPREKIQQILVEQKQSAQRAFQILEEVIDDLNQEKYDRVLNITHNFFSARLMDLIQAPNKQGAAYQDGRKAADQNRWQTYLNEVFSLRAQSRFHYLEVLLRSMELPVLAPRKATSSWSKGPIYLQILTSDSKKNWGLPRFRQLYDQLTKHHLDREIRALCSPGERVTALEFFEEQQLLSPSLEEAAELFAGARLLITGDTSLQHLAAHAGCSVVSLFLGSADAIKTAPWQSDAWVIQSSVSCAPCRHSDPCSRARQECAEEIEVQQVFRLVQDLLQGKEPGAEAKGLSRTQFVQGHFELVPESLNEVGGYHVGNKFLQEYFSET